MLIEDALHALERIHGASPAVGAMCIVPATFAAIALGAHAVRVVPRRTMPVLEAVHTLPVGGAEQIARAVPRDPAALYAGPLGAHLAQGALSVVDARDALAGGHVADSPPLAHP